MAKVVEVADAGGNGASGHGPGTPPGPPRFVRERIFYGWWIVFAGWGLMVVGGGLMFHAFGAYVKVLEEEFGWSRAELSLAFALQRVETGVLGPIHGWAVDRFGPRLIMLIGVVLFALALAAFSLVNSLLGFYLVFALIAIGASLSSMLSVSVAVVNWFQRRRALALGVMSTGVAAGGLVTPAVVMALEGWGWRTTALVSGCVVLAIGLPLASLVRTRPGDHGRTPDGLPPAAAAAAAAAMPETSFTVREAMRTRAFWLLSLGHASGLVTVGAVSVHLFVYVTGDFGESSGTAARLIALLTAMLVVGMLIGGVFGDRMNKRIIIVSAMFGHMTGMLLLAWSPSFWVLTVAVAVQGTAWGARGPLTSALRADYFGPGSYGQIQGFSSLIVMTGMMLGPMIAGFIYDAQGTYTPAFLLLAVLAGLGSLCFIFATRPRPPATALQRL
ncbi:MAG: MFS transporter [Chloroflexi bacterium]|nr:MFS transporter [Chloroflexota bacterium]